MFRIGAIFNSNSPWNLHSNCNYDLVCIERKLQNVQDNKITGDVFLVVWLSVGFYPCRLTKFQSAFSTALDISKVYTHQKDGMSWQTCSPDNVLFSLVQMMEPRAWHMVRRLYHWATSYPTLPLSLNLPLLWWPPHSFIFPCPLFQSQLLFKSVSS
jgi:hypothetical protein